MRGIDDQSCLLAVAICYTMSTYCPKVGGLSRVGYPFRVRLRPILMTSLATIIGMVPLALKLGTGSEQYAPMARAIIGGLTVSVILTVYIVPAAYLMVYGRRGGAREAGR